MTSQTNRMYSFGSSRDGVYLLNAASTSDFVKLIWIDMCVWCMCLCVYQLPGVAYMKHVDDIIRFAQSGASQLRIWILDLMTNSLLTLQVFPAPEGSVECSNQIKLLLCEIDVTNCWTYANANRFIIFISSFYFWRLLAIHMHSMSLCCHRQFNFSPQRYPTIWKMETTDYVWVINCSELSPLLFLL